MERHTFYLDAVERRLSANGVDSNCTEITSEIALSAANGTSWMERRCSQVGIVRNAVTYTKTKATANTMTFEEMKLAMAVSAYSGQDGSTLTDLHTGLDRRARAMAVRDVFTVMFDSTVFQWGVDEVDRAVVAFRKMTTEGRVKMDVARTHGTRCFWVGRGKGPCDENAECGHLVPASQGGELTVENCMIECRAHNNQRRDRTIEQYLSSKDATA